MDITELQYPRNRIKSSCKIRGLEKHLAKNPEVAKTYQELIDKKITSENLIIYRNQ